MRDHRVVELFLALRESSTVSLRVPSGHHVDVGARRSPGKCRLSYDGPFFFRQGRHGTVHTIFPRLR